MPTSTPGATTSSNRPIDARHARIGSTLPNGITAKTASAAARIEIGASMYSTLSTCAGVYSSLKMNFSPSASG